MKNENSNKNERQCSFAVFTSTGEKPDCQISMAGFKKPGGMEMCCQLEGTLRDMVKMTEAHVGNMIDSLREKDGSEAVSAFVCIIGDAIAEHVTYEEMARVNEIGEEKKRFAKKAAKNPILALKELLKKAEESGIDLDALEMDDEDEDDEAEEEDE